MKAVVLVLVLAASMVSAQVPAQPAKADPPKISTKELWSKVKHIFDALKGKLTNPENVQDAKDETAEQLQFMASSFNDAMAGIGNNINNFASKLKETNIQADGRTVKVELEGLGQCGEQVIGSLAQPMAEVVGLLTKKSIEEVKKVDLPKDAPKKLVEDLKANAPKEVLVDDKSG